MQDKTGFYKMDQFHKGCQNSLNYGKFYTIDQSYSDRKKPEHLSNKNLLNKKRRDDWHRSEEQDDRDYNKFYNTKQSHGNYGGYDKLVDWRVDEQKILAISRQQGLTEQEINDILFDIQEYIQSGSCDKKKLCFMLENLAEQKELNEAQISTILNVTKNFGTDAGYVIQFLINNQKLQENHISDVLDIIKTKGINQKPISYMITHLINCYKLHKDHISDVLDIIKSIRKLETKSCLLSNLINKQELEPKDKSILEPKDKSILEPKDKSILEPKGKSISEPKGKSISEPKGKSISEILAMIDSNSWDVKHQIYVLNDLCQKQTLDQKQIDWVREIASGFELNERRFLLQYLSENQKLSDQQINEILNSDTLLSTAINYPIGFFVILKYLVEKQNLSKGQIDIIVFFTSKYLKPNQQNYMLYGLIQYKVQQLTDEHIKEILEIAANSEINQIVKSIEEVEPDKLSIFVVKSSLALTRLEDDKDDKNKDLAKEAVDKTKNQKINSGGPLSCWIETLIKEGELDKEEMFVVDSSPTLTRLEDDKDDKNKDLTKETVDKTKNQKINLEEQLSCLVETLSKKGELSEEKRNNIMKQIYNIALKIITMISSAKQKVFVLAALIKGAEGRLAKEYIDEILNKIENFNLKELCCVLIFLINEQKLGAEHMDTILDMITMGINKSGTIKERIHVLDTLVYENRKLLTEKRVNKILKENQKLLDGKCINKILDENQKLLTSEHIGKILKIIPKLTKEQQIDVLDNLGKIQQLNPEHISEILKIIKSYEGLKEDRLLLEYFIDRQQLNTVHISTVIEIIKSYMKKNYNYSFVLRRLIIKQKQLKLDNEQISEILGIISKLKSQEQSPVLQALLEYGKNQTDQSLIDNIFEMVKNLESREQGFLLERFAKEELLTETRINKTLSMMTNMMTKWESREKRCVMVALIQCKKAQMNESHINTVFEIIKDLDPIDKTLVLQCLAERKVLTETQIDKILGMLQKQQSKNIELTDNQCTFIVKALIQRQTLQEQQIKEISLIITSWDISAKRGFLAFEVLGYLIKDPEAPSKYKQICNILIKTQTLDEELNEKYGAQKQMTKCRGFFLKNYLDKIIKPDKNYLDRIIKPDKNYLDRIIKFNKTIKAHVFKTLKKCMLAAKNKKVNEISPERKKIDTGSKISIGIGNKNSSIFSQIKGNDKKPASENNQKNSPMLQTNNK